VPTSDFNVTSSIVALSSNVTFAAPMSIRFVGSRYAIGTDETNCTHKDATGRNWMAPVPYNFVEFSFGIDQQRYYAFKANVYAPDTLANSVFVQIDGRTAYEWSAMISPVHAENTVEPVMPGSTYASACWSFPAGVHRLRFFSREAGVSISRLRVLPLAPPSFASVAGCDQCSRDGNDPLQLTMSNFCAASMMHDDLILLNGRRCASLVQVSKDAVLCVTPYLGASTPMLNITLQLLDPLTNQTIVVATAERSFAETHDSKGKSDVTAIAIALPLVALLILALATLIAVYLRSSAGTRDVANAPMEGEITILFTDIDHGPELWSHYTLSMAAALDVHHAVIREAISRHGGYEVKTVGDSFMIATKNAEAALAIARDIQIDLQQRSAPRSILAYYENGDEHADDDPTALVPPPPKAGPFHGLRVRMGIHTGKPEVVLDPIAKGYDYYGSDVNLPARIQGCAKGGQILISSTTAAHLSALPNLRMVRGESYHVILRGFSRSIELIDVVLVDLPAKRYFVTEATHSSTTASFVDMSTLHTTSSHSLNSTTNSNSNNHHTMPTNNLAEQVDVLVNKLAGADLTNDGQTLTIRTHVHDRLHLLETLLRPLKPEERHVCLQALFGGWRCGNAPTAAQLQRVPTGDVILPVVSRIVTSELKKTMSSATPSNKTPANGLSRAASMTMEVLATSLDGSGLPGVLQVPQ
jgi:class 3 adenylate cyclase